MRDVNFVADGSRFVSVGYDKIVRLWDTETGQVLRTLDNGKQHYCGTFHPAHDKQNVLMTGCQDKKVYQWDLDTGDVLQARIGSFGCFVCALRCAGWGWALDGAFCDQQRRLVAARTTNVNKTTQPPTKQPNPQPTKQEYNYHLGPVNAVCFYDEGRRFVSSSDDKTLRCWEFGIPVQIKLVADPSMHSMPSLQLSPNAQTILAQSLDNQIVSYTVSKDRFKQNRKKTFKGHNTAGYACQVGFSPDGKYVLSGDGEGRAFFWEWSHPYKIVRTIKAHEGVCIAAAWHPTETSKVITAGWDGQIKMWD